MQLFYWVLVPLVPQLEAATFGICNHSVNSASLTLHYETLGMHDSQMMKHIRI
jgi:hypothetical protein